ncbi:MAG: hypothetical protein M3Y29_06150, partial [Chloroflexota bacterium]|nr:hypothetical protein [Chloroflexota bacterium]
VMLAAPWLPQPAGAPAPLPSIAPVPTATVAAELPPIGLYLLRGPFSFGPCLALELAPESYPVAEGSDGRASVLTWERGMTGCDARSTDVRTIDATVSRILGEGGDPAVVGYAVRFRLPLNGGVETPVEISILAAQSTPELLQALETSTPGSQGLVFDRVASVDPTLNPLPSATPAPEVSNEGPIGLYLLRGPLVENVCIAISLADYSYPPDPAVDGDAFVLWWEHGPAEPDDPAACLSRTGQMQETPATVTPSWDAGVPHGSPDTHLIRFTLPVAGDDAAFELAILAEESNADQLAAVLLEDSGAEEVRLDRVDSIDPPLVTAPSSSPSP